MAQSGGTGDVRVTTAMNHGSGTQFIGNTTIGTLNYAPAKDDHQEQQKQSVLQWLSPPEEALRLQSFVDEECRRNHNPGTGSWFLRNPLIQEWLEGHSKLLWVNGDSKHVLPTALRA